MYRRLRVVLMNLLKTSVVDPEWYTLSPDPDPAFLVVPDPDSTLEAKPVRYPPIIGQF